MSNIVTIAIKYFTENELKCKGTGVIKLDKRFADALVKLRESFKEQMIPSSVCRTPAHNKAVGGHPRSLHLTENPVRPTNGHYACCCYRIRGRGDKRIFRKSGRRLAANHIEKPSNN